ncbi:MAG: hypothetical protein MK213_07670 [Planctomycetes bacterium]|nr:hypothetical protein [Planctomycetota bacterium]
MLKNLLWGALGVWQYPVQEPVADRPQVEVVLLEGAQRFFDVRNGADEAVLDSLDALKSDVTKPVFEEKELR